MPSEGCEGHRGHLDEAVGAYTAHPDGRFRIHSRLRFWLNKALLLLPSRTKAGEQGLSALRLQGKVIKSHGVFLQERHRGAGGFTPRSPARPTATFSAWPWCSGLTFRDLEERLWQQPQQQQWMQTASSRSATTPAGRVGIQIWPSAWEAAGGQRPSHTHRGRRGR